ncbi:MAG: MBOAT family protein [Rhizobiales bacterium]|nr:MBOAT family protein [Hyphomicrobiales bacterium]
MLFHSQLFILAFLPVTVALYYASARSPRVREWLLIAASLFFYSWWDVRFLPLLLAQTLVSWLAAEGAFRFGARWLLGAAIAANLAVLGLYKYLDFFVSIAEDAIGSPLPRADLILPIGISFYTFQIISYLADVLRGEAPRYGIRRFSLFVVLFPQLIAGPIVRHNEIVPQFDLDPMREGVAERIAKGLVLLVAGLVAKVHLADRLAEVVDPIYAAAGVGPVTFAEAGLAILGFALQIFLDFAAYSEMAIGIALMLGLTLPMNFNQPYRAQNLRDFWRRWHMTLSRFLRDYLYIPLGGSRAGWWRYVMASLVTMGLCGLWHGAGWTFIIWGLAHGVGLVVCRAWQLGRLSMPAPLGWLATFSFAVLLFAIFRAPDLATAGHIYGGFFFPAEWGQMPRGGTLVLLAIALAIALAPRPMLSLVDGWQRPRRWMVAAVVVAAVAGILEVGKGQPETFIYFQF